MRIASCPSLVRILECVNITAFAMDRQYEAHRKAKIFRRIQAAADIFHVAAQAGEILAPNNALSAGRTNTVGIVISDRLADRGRQPLTQFLAQVAARLERVTNGRERSVPVRIGEEVVLIERYVVAD